MSWRRAVFAAACLVLAAAIAYPFPAWASATTGVTIVAAENEPEKATGKPTEEENGGSNGPSDASTPSLDAPFLATGDAAGAAFVLMLALAAVASFAIIRHRVLSKERFRMHEINAHAMRGIEHRPRTQRRRR